MLFIVNIKYLVEPHTPICINHSSLLYSIIMYARYTNKTFSLNIVFFFNLLGCWNLVSGQRVPAVSITPDEANVAKFEGESYFVSCNVSDRRADKHWQDPRNVRVPSSEQRYSTYFLNSNVNKGLEPELM
jgi:hypothetical protein